MAKTLLQRLLQLDFDVYAGWQVQLHQRINRLVSRVDNVHQTLVGTDFQLVAAGLVDVGLTQNVKALHAGRQWHGTFNDCTRALRSVNDFSGRRINQLVVKRLQANTDFLFLHKSLLRGLVETCWRPGITLGSQQAQE